MTISSTTDKVQISSGTEITITSLEAQDSSQVLVTKTSSSGVESTLVLTTDYTIDTDLTTVTLNVALAASEKATATLNIPNTQGTDYVNTSPLNAETVETALDKLTLKNKQQQEEIERSIKFVKSETTSGIEIPEVSGNGGKYLRLNSAETDFEYAALASGSGIAEVVDDPSPQLGGDLDTNSNNIQFDDNHGIQDDSGNEQLVFQKTASAVNHLDITNAATGNAPKISAVGDDTNIDLDLETKGTGGLTLNGSSAKVDTILDEDTMSSNDANALATQQSIKAYVDSQSSGGTNLLSNPDFLINQRKSFESNPKYDGNTVSTIYGTGNENDDNQYISDQWVILSDGNDIVDLTAKISDTVNIPTGSRSCLEVSHQTANKQWGLLQVLNNIDSRSLEGNTVSLSFKAKKVVGNTTLENIRVGILSWNGTADSITRDVVSTWAGAGTNPTLATNWTFENTPSTLTLTDSYQTFTVENVSIDTSGTNNVGIFIWCDDTDATIGDIVYVTDFVLNKGSASITYTPRSFAEDYDICRRHEEVLYSAETGYASGGGQSISSVVDFAIEKRIEPTIRVSIGTTNVTAGSVNTGLPNAIEKTHGRYDATSTAAGGYELFVTWHIDARL